MNSRGKAVTRCVSALLLYCSTACLCHAARAPRLRFTTSTDLDGMGLKVKLMPDARAVPLPAPATYKYVGRKETADGVISHEVDMYDPYELWRHSQHGGLWTDEFGNALVIAGVQYAFPGARPDRRHMTREEYDTRSARAIAAAGAWSQARLVQWAADFTGAGKATAEQFKRPPRNLSKLVKFTMQGVPAQKLAYAFQVKQRTVGNRQAKGEKWTFVMFELNPMVNITEANKAIVESFLPSIQPLRRPARTHRKPATGPNSAPPGTAPNDSAARIAASRKRVADSIENLENWWYENTPNYIILSNLRKRHRIMVRYLRRNMELMRGAYAQLVPPGQNVTSVGVIRIFDTPKEYETFVGPAYKWTGGLWMSDRQELVIRPIDWGGSREKRDRVLSVAYHEGFHQYLAMALDEALASPWFNEGHAVLFEAADVRGTRLLLPEHETHAGNMEKMAKAGTLNVGTVFFMDYPQFYAGTDTDRRRNYALAWGLIYYLRKAVGPLRRKDHAAICDTYCDALAETRDPAAATKKAFASIELSDLNAALTEFWKSRSLRRRAERNRIIKPVIAVRK